MLSMYSSHSLPKIANFALMKSVRISISRQPLHCLSSSCVTSTTHWSHQSTCISICSFTLPSFSHSLNVPICLLFISLFVRLYKIFMGFRHPNGERRGQKSRAKRNIFLIALDQFNSFHLCLYLHFLYCHPHPHHTHHNTCHNTHHLHKNKN